MGERHTKHEVVEFLHRRSISLVGVAETPRLPAVPGNGSPHSILRDVKTVICYGVPIPRGILYADNHDMSLYWRYCTILYKSLDIASNQLCLFLEDKGYRACPIYGCYPMRTVGRQYWGLLPLVHWAEEAGLGRLTKSGLLANPEYGTRIILGGVLSTAPLPPSVKCADDPCPSDCFDCVDACPVHAIARGGGVDHAACMRFANASPLLENVLRDRTAREKFPFETILNTVAVDEHATYSCNACMKVCPLNRK